MRTFESPERRLPKRRPHTIAQEMQVISLTKDHCRREIGEIVGLHKTTVSEIQQKYHLVVSFGHHHGAQFQKKDWDRDKWGLLFEELYGRQRLPLKEVAKRCGLGVKTTRSRLVQLGFEIRSWGEAQRGRPRHFRQAVWCACGRRIAKPAETRCYRCREAMPEADLAMAA